MKLKNRPLFTNIKLILLLQIVLSCFLNDKAFAVDSVRVAFFVSYDQNNQLIELVPGGKFYHTAIQIKGQWYHASPTNGVEGVENLIQLTEEHLFVTRVLESNKYPLTTEDVLPYIGLPFDYLYEWEDCTKTDCLKFIAKLLNVAPTQADFLGSHWAISYGITPGGPGLSPDELYRRLIEMGFTKVDAGKNLKSTGPLTCRKILKSS